MGILMGILMASLRTPLFSVSLDLRDALLN